MIISDLNYLEAITEEIVGGGYFTFDKQLSSTILSNQTFNSTTTVNDIFNKQANIAVTSNVTGNSSTLTYDNEAIGPNSNTQAVVNQETIAGGGSSQNGSFVSATNY